MTGKSNRPQSRHTGQALDSDLDIRAWQVGQIETAIAEMDAGKGIPHAEIERELLTWGKGDKAERRN